MGPSRDIRITLIRREPYMSYCIEFNRQVIRSGLGYTPCWLSGDNNVRETSNGRVARNWSIFVNLLAVSEEDIIKKVESFMDGSNEHWMRRGKWMDDAGILRWAKTGCKKAATVEEILKANPGLISIGCRLSVWEKFEHHFELCTSVSSTRGFDEWIVSAKKRIAELSGKGCSVFPIVDFGKEDLRHPQKATGREVLLKSRGKYLCEVRDDGAAWNTDPRKAMVLSEEEAEEIIRRYGHYPMMRKASMVSAKVKEEPFDAVVSIYRGSDIMGYIYSVSSHGLKRVSTIDNAKRYKNAAAAKAAADRLRKRAWKEPLAFRVQTVVS